jgi:hypothetical protein
LRLPPEAFSLPPRPDTTQPPSRHGGISSGGNEELRGSGHSALSSLGINGTKPSLPHTSLRYDELWDFTFRIKMAIKTKIHAQDLKKYTVIPNTFTLLDTAGSALCVTRKIQDTAYCNFFHSNGIVLIVWNHS